MDRNNTNEPLSKGLQKFADISREFNKRYHSFLEQQAHFNEMIAPISTAMEQLNRSNLISEAAINSIEMYSVAQNQGNISKIDFSQLAQAAGKANQLVQPYGNLLSAMSDNTDKIIQITSEMAHLNTDNIMNSITDSVAQFRCEIPDIDFNKLGEAAEMANRSKESIGNLLPSANIISQAASNMANPDTNNILNSIKLGSLAAASAQYQPDISRIDFNGLTRAIIEVNSLKEPLNLLSSIYNNVAANSPYFYGWYNTLDSTIIETIRQRVTLMPDFSGIDRITV